MPPHLKQAPHQNWRSLSTADLVREYSPSSAIGGNYQPFIRQYEQRSEAIRASFSQTPTQPVYWGLAYGEASTQTLDLFMPSAAAALPALVVFIHGGYWQELSKNDSHFAARDAVQAGCAFATLDYTLAPTASVADIVLECKQALGFLYAHAAALGFDARRIVLAGSSAGAHLAAMTALGAVPLPSGELRRNTVNAVVLVSGIFELEPLIHTPINDALNMTATQAQALSPALASHTDLAHFPPCCMAWGARETPQFKQQSANFAHLLTQCTGHAPRTLEVLERNHFDVVLDLCNPDTQLGQAVLTLVQTTALSQTAS